MKSGENTDNYGDGHYHLLAPGISVWIPDKPKKLTYGDFFRAAEVLSNLNDRLGLIKK